MLACLDVCMEMKMKTRCIQIELHSWPVVKENAAANGQ